MRIHRDLSRVGRERREQRLVRVTSQRLFLTTAESRARAERSTAKCTALCTAVCIARYQALTDARELVKDEVQQSLDCPQPA